MKPFARLFVRLFAVVAVLLAAGAARAQDYPIDRVLGKPDAPVTLIEYASLTCGHCANFHLKGLPGIKRDWIETGKVKLIYRDFPTGPRGLSLGAAMLPHCAGPERYFAVLGLLFERQEQWMASKNPLEDLKRVVKIAGMGEEKVESCLKDQVLASAIEARAAEANKKFGIDGTPAFLVGGKLISGDRPGEIEDALRKASGGK